MLTLLLGRKSFFVYIAVLIFLLLAAICIPTLSLAYRYAFSEEQQQYQQFFNQKIEFIELALNSELRQNTSVLHGLHFSGLQQSKSWEERNKYINELTDIINKNPSFFDIYIGYDNGDYMMVSRNDPWLSQGHKLPKGVTWNILESSADNKRNSVRFLNAELKEVYAIKDRNLPAYDPRTRGWYKAAMKIKNDAPVFIPAYQSWGSKTARNTAVIRSSENSSVIGIHQPLDFFDKILSNLPDYTNLMLFDASNEAIYIDKTLKEEMFKLKLSSFNEHPIYQGVHDFLQEKNRPNGIAMRTYHIKEKGFWNYHITNITNSNSLLVFAYPKDKIMDKIQAKMAYVAWYMLLGSLFFIPAIWWIARLAARPLKEITAEAKQLNQFIFNSVELKGSDIYEINELAMAINRMKHSLDNFMNLGRLMAEERDFVHLQERLLLESCKVVHASMAILYVKDSDDMIRPHRSCRDGSIRDIEGLPNFLDKGTSVLSGIYDKRSVTTEISESYWQQLVENWGSYPGRHHVIAIPLLDHGEELVGALVMVLPQQDSETLDSQIRLIEAVSGTAAASLRNQRLLQEQKNLIDSFIELIASSVDAKSPYTGGHCLRVPMLTEKMVTLASQKNDGEFADFNPDENDWEAIRIASWLHDCGKITTPEFVMDKATKLETLYDRIHEIRARFEILKRDAQITEQQKYLTPEQIALMNSAVTETWQQLDDEFAFVAHCNIGEQFTSPDDVAKLNEIGKRQWLRTIDNRLGLSHDELARMPKQQTSLPAVEYLLSNRPEHVIPRPAKENAAKNADYGFKVEVPESLYNRGELYNLTIPRGTLTAEERYKINEHIIQTIKMLKHLPFAQHLKAIPEIAGGHHERIDGKGYPMRLNKEKLSIPARIIAIADIFEALTASDRPYKKFKTIGLSLKIMKSMALEGHIDPELYNLFIESEVWREYGQEFLLPEQMDSVDKQSLLIES